MAVLGTEWIEARSDHGYGTPYRFKSEITVDREGDFRFTIPTDLVNCARKLAMKEEMRPFTVSQLRTKWVVCGPEKARVQQFIHKIIIDYLDSEVKREMVILYDADVQVGYWKTPDGEITAFGGSKHRGQWEGPLHATNLSEHYSVGLVARIYNKVTVMRESGNEVSFERLDLWEQLKDDHHNPATWAGKLNSFVGLSFNERDLERMDSLPYTEEAAQFFYEAMLAMCKLADRISAFFNNPEAIQRAIETRTTFLLGGGK